MKENEQKKQKRYQIEGPGNWGIIDHADTLREARAIIHMWVKKDEDEEDEDEDTITECDCSIIDTNTGEYV